MKMTARSLREILGNPVVSVVLDRNVAPTQLDSAVAAMTGYWTTNMLDRNPKPAFGEEPSQLVYRGTDLDLFTVLATLADRQAVVNLPEYENLRAKTVRSDQVVLATSNRHGKLLNIVGNAKTHAFSARIYDQNVVQKSGEKQDTGAYRNFALVDDSGVWHGGWKRLEFIATGREKAFINEHKLESSPNVIAVKNFVHPNLAGAFMGSPYVSTSILEQRITEEKGFYNGLAQQLRAKGVTLGGNAGQQHVQTSSEPGQSTVVSVLEAKVLCPEYSGSYKALGMTANGEVIEYKSDRGGRQKDVNLLRYAERRAKELHGYQTKLRARMNAIELAFHKHGLYAPQQEKPVGWDTARWQRDYKETPASRILWNVMPLNDNVALLYRIKNISVMTR
jgi:hypothetical protein